MKSVRIAGPSDQHTSPWLTRFAQQDPACMSRFGSVRTDTCQVSDDINATWQLGSVSARNKCCFKPRELVFSL
jgi:hypothetical protein